MKTDDASHKELIFSLEQGKLCLRPWTQIEGRYEECELSECVAVSVPAAGGGAVTKRVWADWETGEETVETFDDLTREQATVVAHILKAKYGFSGHFDRSRSGKTWNFWREVKCPSPELPSRTDGEGGEGKTHHADWVTRDLMRRQYPAIRNDPYADHWIDLADEIGEDPDVLRDNLD